MRVESILDSPTRWGSAGQRAAGIQRAPYRPRGRRDDQRGAAARLALSPCGALRLLHVVCAREPVRLHVRAVALVLVTRRKQNLNPEETSARLTTLFPQTRVGEIMKKPFALASFMLVLFAGCAAASQPSSPSASPAQKLKVAPEESLSMIVPANGVQIYECRASQDKGGRYEWAFVGPEADLFDRRGMKIGRHYAGPHWEAMDGSKIIGLVKASSAAPDEGAIPWLLLGAKSVGPAGTFSNVSTVRRVHTVGGIAPDNGCSAAAAGTRARVAYTADYYFFTKE